MRHLGSNGDSAFKGLMLNCVRPKLSKHGKLRTSFGRPGMTAVVPSCCRLFWVLQPIATSLLGYQAACSQPVLIMQLQVACSLLDIVINSAVSLLLVAARQSTEGRVCESRRSALSMPADVWMWRVGCAHTHTPRSTLAAGPLTSE